MFILYPGQQTVPIHNTREVLRILGEGEDGKEFVCPLYLYSLDLLHQLIKPTVMLRIVVSCHYLDVFLHGGQFVTDLFGCVEVIGDDDLFYLHSLFPFFILPLHLH
jgi:hypothetical protein